MIVPTLVVELIASYLEDATPVDFVKLSAINRSFQWLKSDHCMRRFDVYGVESRIVQHFLQGSESDLYGELIALLTQDWDCRMSQFSAQVFQIWARLYTTHAHKISLEWIPPSVLLDEAVLLKLVRERIPKGEYSHLKPFANNKQIFEAAVQVDGNALALASPALKQDRHIVQLAISSCPRALQHAEGGLQGDREIVQRAVSADGSALMFAAPHLRADRRIVTSAVQQNGWALQDASHELRGDRLVVLEAIRASGWALQYASPELRQDREVIAAAVQAQPHVLCLPGFKRCLCI